MKRTTSYRKPGRIAGFFLCARDAGIRRSTTGKKSARALPLCPCTAVIACRFSGISGCYPPQTPANTAHRRVGTALAQRLAVTNIWSTDKGFPT
ncbi:hypothetical protein DBY65_026140 [Pseudomonas sp. RIT412]|nr:hypothetical protein DBP26_025825 [Pseudomonas sp. RIT 409]RAU46013.1 hypothetical protein DBY65_026140 [Pseudomonas sp. RIT 412]